MTEALRLVRFKARAKSNGRFVGWATVALSHGIILPSVPIYVNGLTVTASPPVRVVLQADGAGVEHPVIGFATPDDHDAFSTAVGAMVLAAHPEILRRSP